MCGIVGILNRSEYAPVSEKTIRQMLSLIQHRGPDEFGIFLDDHIGLGSARLSIVDLVSGQQPITNEDESCWIVFNGEIFNDAQLRYELKKRGHHFRTNSDTEVILHLYEDEGENCLERLNGQFALAIWNPQKEELFLARDRTGIRPLYYTITDNHFIFGSEIKTLFVHKSVTAKIDPLSFDQLFRYWCLPSPQTIFKGIKEIPPGHFLKIKRGIGMPQKYWQLDFTEQPKTLLSDEEIGNPGSFLVETERSAKQLMEILVEAVTMRLRGDVPVGAYLSGGLDSSIITSIIRKYTQSRLDTFSISFSDPKYDESEYQINLSKHLGVDHHTVHITSGDVGRIFPEVIWHAETPLLRTSPAPMYLLSKLVNKHGYKVVMTGEGADEIFLGYNLFKEAKVRAFWAKNPGSDIRPLLLNRLYPYIAGISQNNISILRAFFEFGLTDLEDPYYSHKIRWHNTERTKRIFSKHLLETITTDKTNFVDQVEPWESPLPLPESFHRWDLMKKAQYIEIMLFMSQYLLSSQGDRMMMAHSVEGRFPFLDHHLIEYANLLPSRMKLWGLNEKYLLKIMAKNLIPEEIRIRRKKPYRAPILNSFLGDHRPEYLEDILSKQSINESGLFDIKAVELLLQKADRRGMLSETEEMALTGIISSQLLYESFVRNFRNPPPISDEQKTKIVNKTTYRNQENNNDIQQRHTHH